jgi:hypothetical protein
MSIEESTYEVVKIPKLNFKNGDGVVRQAMEESLIKELKEIFNLFAQDGKVNPHDLKNGLRSVSTIFI